MPPVVLSVDRQSNFGEGPGEVMLSFYHDTRASHKRCAAGEGSKSCHQHGALHAGVGATHSASTLMAGCGATGVRQ